AVAVSSIGSARVDCAPSNCRACHRQVPSRPHPPNAVANRVCRGETMVGCRRTSVGEEADFQARSEAPTHHTRPDSRLTLPADMAAPLPPEQRRGEPIQVEKGRPMSLHIRVGLLLFVPLLSAAGAPSVVPAPAPASGR